MTDDAPPNPPEAKSIPQWIRKVIKTRRGLIAVASASFLIILITLVAVLAFGRSSERTETDSPPSSSRDEDTDTNRFTEWARTFLLLINRDEWLAQPPQHPADPLKHPVPYVIILHTATDNCTTQAKCTFFVRKTQTFHIESFGWWDIGYSFLVGGDGYAYEGRGWDGIGAFAYGYNNRSIGISFIGTFIKVLPPPQQIQAAKQLIVEGVRLGKISPNYKLLAHRQVSATESPGQIMDGGVASPTLRSTKTNDSCRLTRTGDLVQTTENHQHPAFSKSSQKYKSPNNHQKCKSDDKNGCSRLLDEETFRQLQEKSIDNHLNSKHWQRTDRDLKTNNLPHRYNQSEEVNDHPQMLATGESTKTSNHQMTCESNANYQLIVTSGSEEQQNFQTTNKDNCRQFKINQLSIQQKNCQTSKYLNPQSAECLIKYQQSTVNGINQCSAKVDNHSEEHDVNDYNLCTGSEFIHALESCNSDQQQASKSTIQGTTTDNRLRQSDNDNHNYERSNLSFGYCDSTRQTSCSSDEVFTSSSQDDTESYYSESICTSHDDTESIFGGSTSSTQDELGMASTIQVNNCSKVQIGSTINFNGPVTVTENCEQKLPLESMFSNAQVNVFDGSVAEVGTRVNYNGPVNITKIVNVGAIQYEEFERLAIEDKPQTTDKISEPDTLPKTHVRLINRRMWLAQPPLEQAEELQHPLKYVVILHTATEECLKQSDCVFMTRHIQNFHIEGYGWWDIGYSFLIGGDGNVYEGRGWDHMGAFAKGYNHLSIGIALIGTFTNVLPSELQLRTLDYWIEEGVRLGKISPDYKILTHQQLSRTTSPGTAFVQLIKTWPRWSDTPQKE
ncbi:hypothetical protein C0J52_21009 [Blattella germanica]|nr:hypothetical protein C0J52_21009 [Blattella germanica]